MATYTRANAWNNGGTFANTDLLWYAKGVGAMQARQLSDPSSWWFFAAIHGEYVTPDIPPAFTQPNLPDGSPNPLFVTARYGPDRDGDGQFPADVELDIENAELSPGVRRMLAMVGLEGPSITGGNR
jgi:hypothetical protein